MLNNPILVVILVWFFVSPLPVCAITEQEVEDEIDFRMGLRSWTRPGIETAGARVNPILTELLVKHRGDTTRQRFILDLMDKHPEPNMVVPILDAYKGNVELEGDVFGLLLDINTDESYLAAKNIAFNSKWPREKWEEHNYDAMDNVRSLVYGTTRESLKYIVPELKDSGGIIAKWIIDVMIEKGEPAAIVPPIAELLESDDVYTRMTAAEALGKIGDTSAVPALRKAKSRERNLNAQRGMAAELVRLGEFQELKFLIQEVGNESKDVRDAVAKWLTDITGQDFGQNEQAWRHGFEAEKRRRRL